MKTWRGMGQNVFLFLDLIGCRGHYLKTHTTPTLTAFPRPRRLGLAYTLLWPALDRPCIVTIFQSGLDNRWITSITFASLFEDHINCMPSKIAFTRNNITTLSHQLCHYAVPFSCAGYRFLRESIAGEAYVNSFQQHAKRAQVKLVLAWKKGIESTIVINPK